MSDCALTLDILDPDDIPVANGAIAVAPAVPAAGVGGGKMIAAEKFYALSDPFHVVTFVRGALYRWREYKPKGQTFYAYCPNTATANYSDLVPVVPVSPGLALADVIIHNVLADVESESRELLDELFSETVVGAVTDGAVGALVNDGPNTKDALGDEADDGTSPLGESIQGTALVAALIYGGN